ncbi:MAG TPA: sterol desaturase family protein [Rhodocyclaceae bacterium]
MLLAYLAIFLAFVVVFTREVIAPASRASCDKRWLRMAGTINFLQMSAAVAAGYYCHGWFEGHALLHLEGAMPDPLAGALIFGVASLVAYWWHRAVHKSDWLWRVFHQLHHSPSRIEALTAFYLHPFDSIAATFITCSVAYLLLGLSATAAAWALVYVSFFNLYIHSDTSSPLWLGYLVQRPEMHRVHHQLGHHAQNYGLPIWDLIFGTWVNPTTRVTQCGFDSDRSERICDMLRSKDVHQPKR